jgi:putative heme-binding domain-containing protein
MAMHPRLDRCFPIRRCFRDLRRRANRSILRPALLFLAATLPAGRGAEVLVSDDYNQWKQALGTNVATAAERTVALPGFQAELVRSAQPGEGSWVAMAFDPRGRIVVAREDRGLLRMTLPGDSAASVRVETINTNLLECRGLLFAHGALYANANNSKGLYRLRDTDGDDKFDDVRLLLPTAGGVGHGRNQLALGPDGMIYSIHGDDVQLPTNGVARPSLCRHGAEDHLLECAWDKVSFNSYARMPYGHLLRLDPDAEHWELVACGLRNPFGLAFNEAGDLFTYDADMEWDIGLPWYHPTRVLHLVSGGDYGWRRGTGVLPAWSPDTLPSVVDIGVGSPTAIQFGTKSRFPAPWRQALFILDWAYGKIYAIHLQRSGPTYTGRSEVFLSGRPLNVTGLDFGPDGALYFVTGGRRTQSGLYRVSWTNGPVAAPAVSARDAAGPRYEEILFRLRHAPLDEVWTMLNAGERWTRYAARLVLEERPISAWQNRALTEPKPQAALTALLALARAGDRSALPDVIRRFLAIPSRALSPDQQLLALRGLAVGFSRSGAPDPDLARQCRERWDGNYPTADPRLNQAACELLVLLDSTNVVPRTLPLLAAAGTQNEKFHYLLMLRRAKSGWTPALRRSYFEWLVRAGREFHGANTLPIVLKFIRQEAEAGLNPAEQAALADLLAALDRPAEAAPAPPATPRAFVRNWTLADLTDLWPATKRSNDSALGGRLFTEAGCAQCHRFGSTGGVVGPDLTAVGSRLDRRALLESMLEPSKVIADVYRTTMIVTRAGEIFEGRVLAESEQSVTLGIDPLDPTRSQQVIARTEIESRRLSAVSPMPAGLLDTLSRDDILALLTWLEAR